MTYFIVADSPLKAIIKPSPRIGIKTIIDLRNDEESFAKSAAEAAGLKYYNIPMNGVSAPTDADVAQFLKIVNDPASGKVYMHCKAGIHGQEPWARFTGSRTTVGITTRHSRR